MAANNNRGLFKSAIEGVKTAYSNEKPSVHRSKPVKAETSIFSRLKMSNKSKLPDSIPISKHRPYRDSNQGSWKRQKQQDYSQRSPTHISGRAQRDLKSRFGNRLVLKTDLGRPHTNVIDRVNKGVKQNQMDPDSSEKWGHDQYEGPKKTEEDSYHRSASPVYKSREAKKYTPLPVEEHDIPTHQPKQSDGLNKVLVRGLPNDIKREQVQEIFTRYGEVRKAQVEDGFAIVTFSSNEGALQAHYVTNHKKMLKINGSVIKVSVIEDDDQMK
jgi:hypothetical protein